MKRRNFDNLRNTARLKLAYLPYDPKIFSRGESEGVHIDAGKIDAKSLGNRFDVLHRYNIRHCRSIKILHKITRKSPEESKLRKTLDCFDGGGGGGELS